MQEHQAHRAGQHEQRRLHRSHELVLHAGDLEAARIARVRGRASDGVDLVLGRLQRDAVARDAQSSSG